MLLFINYCNPDCYGSKMFTEELLFFLETTILICLLLPALKHSLPDS